MNDQATILLLHGSKDPAWLEPFVELRNRAAAASPGKTIVTACLQFGSPTLNEAVGALVAGGFRNFVVVPVFISTKGHVAKDVPLLVNSAREEFPDTEIRVSPAIGELPAVQQAMIEGIAEITMN